MTCGMVVSEPGGTVGDASFPCDVEFKLVGIGLASGFSSALEILRSERSIGFAISSKLELSPSFTSSESPSSLSAYLDARLDIEPACSFMDGGGARNARDGCGTSLTVSASGLVAA